MEMTLFRFHRSRLLISWSSLVTIAPKEVCDQKFTAPRAKLLPEDWVRGGNFQTTFLYVLERPLSS